MRTHYICGGKRLLLSACLFFLRCRSAVNCENSSYILVLCRDDTAIDTIAWSRNLLVRCCALTEQDSRWGDAEKKLLRRTKFSKVLEQKVSCTHNRLWHARLGSLRTCYFAMTRCIGAK